MYYCTILFVLYRLSLKFHHTNIKMYVFSTCVSLLSRFWVVKGNPHPTHPHPTLKRTTNIKGKELHKRDHGDFEG